jgi:hypothetical protein
MKTTTPPVYIRLPDYQYFDSPYSKDENREVDLKYMERSEIETQLKARLRDQSNTRSGALLVTGFRGCGKTSLVHKVIKDLNARPKSWWGRRAQAFGFGPGRLHEGEINIAQDDIDERAILRLIAIELRRVLKEVRILPFDIWTTALRLFKLLITAVVFVAAVPYFWRLLEEKFPDPGAIRVLLRDGFLSTILRTKVKSDEVKEGAEVAGEAVPGGIHIVMPSTDGFSWLGLIESLAVPVVLGILTYIALSRVYRRLAQRYRERSISRLIDRLNVLIARMQSEVITEQSGGIGSTATHGLFNLGMKRSSRFPFARTKEVEQEIVDVLRVFGDIAKPNRTLKRVWTWAFPHSNFLKRWDRRRIVFVIDELDKLIPHSRPALAEKDDEDPTDVPVQDLKHGSKGYENEWLRRRQEAIAALFGNLKHFLNVAQAKFIFIGGRELFEAVLADTSNRDAFFSSVFSHVFYVPTFLKESQRDEHGVVEGLTTTTERFVAEAVLGKRYRKGPQGVQHIGEFRHFRREYRKAQLAQRPKHWITWTELWRAYRDRPEAARSKHLTSLRDLLQEVTKEMEQRKALAVQGPAQSSVQPSANTVSIQSLSNAQVLHAYAALQNMAVYLTFRSHGIAKNLVRIFERSIVPLSDADVERLSKDASAVVILRGTEIKGGLFLRLDQHQQYAHAFLTYLYRPFLSLNSNFYRSLNDKQQVALTYLLDHIIKYHGIAFSFMHLESAPETIEVNKVPDFRKFLTLVVSRFTSHHIRSVDNGLFGYHFYNKIYHEVAYLSKVSELDAAAMNFTLDESLPVKQHFYKRLYHLIKLDKQRDRKNLGRALSPTADIHQWLGDLHFYDTEHEEALGQYRAAAAYYAPALWHAESQQPSVNTFNVHASYHGGGGAAESAVETAVDKKPSVAGPARMVPEHFREYVKLTLRQIHCLEKMKALEDAIVMASSLSGFIHDYLNTHLTPINGSEFDWRLLSLAMAVKPSIIEKHSRRGVQSKDLEQVRHFGGLITNKCEIPKEEGQKLSATLNMYIGSILFYGNHPAWKAEDTVPLGFNGAGSCYRQALRRLVETRPKEGDEHELEARAGENKLSGEYEAKAAAHWYINYSSRSIDPEKPRSKSELLLAANTLSKYTDVLISRRVDGKCPASAAFRQVPGTPVLLAHSDVGLVCGYVLLACDIYKRADHEFQAVFQIKKLYYFLIERLRKSDKTADKLISEMDDLRKWAKSAVHGNYQHMDRQQLAKFKSQTKKKEGIEWHGLQDDRKRFDVVSYRPELFELDLLHKELRLRLLGEGALADVEKFLQGNELQVSLQFTRARHLMLCMRYNWLRLGKDIREGVRMRSKELNAHIQKHGAGKVHSAIVDALHCGFQLLGIMDMMGPSFMNNHTLMALANKHIGDWCYLLSRMNGFEESSTAVQKPLKLDIRIRKELAALLDGKVESRLDALMYYSVARTHGARAASVHTRGRNYGNFMGDMFFVEDDHMDNLYHFTCALERMRMAPPVAPSGTSVHERMMVSIQEAITALEAVDEDLYVVPSTSATSVASKPSLGDGAADSPTGSEPVHKAVRTLERKPGENDGGKPRKDGGRNRNMGKRGGKKGGKK